jgi:PDDEXK-like domain of unknown function (DUF3799)
MRIDKPGIYLDVPSIEYHADPCASPSFSQSLGKILLEKSPLHAWYAHPRLNPDFVAEDPVENRIYDLGNASHLLMLGRGREIVELPNEFADWRKDKPKELRAAAHKEGKLAVLSKTYDRAERMVLAGQEQLALMPPPANELFNTTGNSEVCAIWKEGGLWCRQLIDWLSSDGTIVADYKTTDMSCAPQLLGKKMQVDNWPIQAAMAERGLAQVLPLTAGIRRYFFVAQETTQPYALSVAELTEGHLERGRMQLELAIDIMRSCMKHNRWPGYPRAIIVPDYPGWADAEWEDRRMQIQDRKMITEIV